MPLRMVALLLGVLPPGQDPSPEPVVAAMQARVPRFRDLELRYLGKVHLFGESEAGFESRVILVPGTGYRADVSVLSARGAVESRRMEVHLSSAEVGDGRFLWAPAARGPVDLLGILPPCLSLKGSRKDSAMPAPPFCSGPFLYVREDWGMLYALMPREAFAREPGLKSRGRMSVEGRDCHVLEVPMTLGKASAVPRALFPALGMPTRRFTIDAATCRPWRIDFDFGQERGSYTVRWEVKSWREASGIQVPAEVELVVGARRLSRKLASVSVDKGLTAAELVPEDRRKEVFLEAADKSVESCAAEIEKDPGNPAAWAGRAVARYREAALQGMQRGKDPRLDLAEAIDDLEKARALAPSSPFLALSLLRFCETGDQQEKLSALARALDEPPPDRLEVRLALARHWVKAGEGARALRQIEGVESPAGGLLLPRLEVGRLRVYALASGGKGAEAGRALAGLLRDRDAGELDVLMDVLLPLPAMYRGAPALEEDKELQAAIEAAVAASPGSAPLQEMRLRSALRAGDPERMRKALEECVEAVDDPATLDRAARLALNLHVKDDASMEALAACEGAARKVVKKVPDSPGGSLLLGLALLRGGKQEDALGRLEAVLGGLEKGETDAEDADRQGEYLGILIRAFAEAGREGSALRACRLFVRCINLSSRPYLLLRGDGNDPISTCVTALLAKSRHADVVRLLKEMEPQKFDYLYNLRRTLRPHEEAIVKVAREEILAKSSDPAEYLRVARMILRTTTRPQEALPVLEKARELAPANVEVLDEMARLCMGQGGDRERAIQLFEELVTALEKAPAAKISRDYSIFMIAQLQSGMGRVEKAAAALDRMDMGAPAVAPMLMSAGTIYDQAGRAEKAIAAYRRYIEAYREMPYRISSSIYGQMGRLHEKLEQYDEAYRAYTQGIELARRERERGQMYSPPFVPGQRPADSWALREALLQKLGRDFFIGKFLRGPLGPLAPEEERRVRECYEKLRSDSIAEREDADAGIRKIGPRAAPLIKGGLHSPDPEFKARVRQILVDWSEPR